MLNKRLATLQHCGLIVRKKVPDPKVYEYQLTESGRELFPLVLKMAEWGMRWARGTMRDEELDVGLLMTDIQRRIDPDEPSQRTDIDEIQVHGSRQVRQLVDQDR